VPAYVFNDNLQSYSPGSGYPSGFMGSGIVFTHDFVNGSASPTPSPIGFYENAGIYFSFFGTGLTFPVTADLAMYFTPQTSVAWWAWGQDPQFPPGGLQLVSINPVNPSNTFTLLSIEFQPDNSVSLLAPGATSVNSLVQCFDYFTWTFFSMNASFSSALVGGVSCVNVTVNMYVNGVQLFSSAFLQTTVPVSSLWNASPGINQWNFPTANYGYLGVTSAIEPLPFYPNPGATINAKAPQMIAEIVNLPLPPNARAAQLIVEIIIKGLVIGAPFPEYIKSHTRPGH
jgi:hypothetical protein